MTETIPYRLLIQIPQAEAPEGTHSRVVVLIDRTKLRELLDTLDDNPGLEPHLINLSSRKAELDVHLELFNPEVHSLSNTLYTSALKDVTMRTEHVTLAS